MRREPSSVSTLPTSCVLVALSKIGRDRVFLLCVRSGFKMAFIRGQFGVFSRPTISANRGSFFHSFSPLSLKLNVLQKQLRLKVESCVKRRPKRKLGSLTGIKLLL